MSSYFLSDDISNPTKWSFPDVSINSNDFLLIWCSGDTTFGEYHSNFKLSASGEDVVLSQVIDNETSLIDGLSFGFQSSDISFGRETDAHPNWVFFPYPTPNASNGTIPTFIDSRSKNESSISAFPNPYLDHIKIVNPFDEEMMIEVYSLSGQLLAYHIIGIREQYLYFDFEEKGIRILKWHTDTRNGALKIVKL